MCCHAVVSFGVDIFVLFFEYDAKCTGIFAVCEFGTIKKQWNTPDTFTQCPHTHTVAHNKNEVVRVALPRHQERVDGRCVSTRFW